MVFIHDADDSNLGTYDTMSQAVYASLTKLGQDGPILFLIDTKEAYLILCI